MIKQSSLLIRVGVLTLAALFSIQASAALGKIRVLSKLGQPLHAEISLTGSTGKEPNSLRVGVATDGDFKELSISSPTQAGNISLNVVHRGKSRVLIVKSASVVNEPLFRFAIQAISANGSVTREYTVVLDPPQYQSSKYSNLYHRYSEKPIEKLPAVKVALIREVTDSFMEYGGRLSKVNDEQLVTPAVSVSPSEGPVAQGGEASAPIDMTLMELEAQVKARDEAIKANNDKLAELERKVEAIRQQMGQQPVQVDSQSQGGEEGTGIIDMLMDNLMMVVAVVFAVVLLILLLMRMKRRKADNNSPALTLHVGAPYAGGATQPKQPDVPKPMAFNQGAQQRQQASAQATFMTDFTQMSGAIDTGEVDPIAEAEVYIAYGRDTQAEEILLDALKQDPSRHEVRMKLMELYASKSDVQHFEKLAQEMHDAFDGRGALWAKAAAMGLALDPANSLYQMSEAPATRPIAASSTIDNASGLISLDEELAAADLSAQFEEETPDEGAETEFYEGSDAEENNDELLSALFSDDVQSTTASSIEELDEAQPVEELDAELSGDDGQQLNFSLDSLLAMANPGQEQDAQEEDDSEKDALLEFNLSEIVEAEAAEKSAAQETEETPAPTFAADFIEFDLSDSAAASSDKDGVEPAATVSTTPAVTDDPLSTKLDLAQVYLDMGDEEGAKEVLQELLAEADGTLRDEALGMLARIGAQ